jgi:hypothetical protein
MKPTVFEIPSKKSPMKHEVNPLIALFIANPSFCRVMAL